MDDRQHLLRLASKPVCFFLALFILLFILPVSLLAQENCTELLTKRCETCHYLTRVCQKVEREMKKKSWFGGPAGTWKRIIKNMVKQGAILNKEEEKTLVDCLSKPTDEALKLCEINK